MDRKPLWRKVLAAALLLAAVAAAWRYTPLAEILTVQNIAAWSRMVRGYWWAPFLLMAAYIVAACVLFPQPILTLVSVVTFGVWPGVAYAVAGMVIAAVSIYGAGRLLPDTIVRRIGGDHLDAAANAARRHGVLTVFAANMTPVPPFVVQNIVAGAIRMKLWQVALGTLLASLPGAIAFTVFGRELNAMLQESGELNYWVVGLGIAVFGVFLIAMRRWARRQR